MADLDVGRNHGDPTASMNAQSEHHQDDQVEAADSGRGGVDMKVVFEMEPSGVGHEARMTFRDTEAQTGLHPLLDPGRTTDGAKAWVSPFYVTIT